MRNPHAAISNSWSATKIVCLNHEIPKVMEIAEIRRQMVYICPDVEGQACKCKNCLTVNDFNKMLDHINDRIVEAAMEDRQVVLKHYSWKDRNGIRYHILEHTDDGMIVGVLNTKAIKST